MIMILKDLISDVLNKMFFMMETNPPKKIVETYDFSAGIKGDFFEIKIFLNSETAAEITTNFLGFDETPEDEDIVDSIKEILNMIVGNFIGQHYPEHQSVLYFPYCKKESSNEKEVSDFDKELLFYDNIPLAIYLKVSDEKN